MKQRTGQVQDLGFSAEREWTAEGMVVLRGKVELPPPPEDASPRAVRRIQRYYRCQGQAYLRRCEHLLLPEAQAACRLALAESRPIPCFQAELSGQVTLQAGALWSLCTQARECDGTGNPALLLRWGDCWDSQSGWLLPLSAFFPPEAHWRRQILHSVEASIEAQLNQGLALYRPDWKRRLRRSFDPKSFYLTNQGLVLFWPMYTLAPALEGIPSFTLPYGPQGPLPLPRGWAGAEDRETQT